MTRVNRQLHNDENKMSEEPHVKDHYRHMYEPEPEIDDDFVIPGWFTEESDEGGMTSGDPNGPPIVASPSIR